MLLHAWTIYVTVYVTIYVTVHVTVYVTVYVTIYVNVHVTVYVTVYVTPTSQLSAAVQLWKEPNPQLQAKSRGISGSSSKLSRLISVEVKASEDEAKKNKKKQKLKTTDVMLREVVHEDYIHESKRDDVQRFDYELLRHAAENDTDKTTENVECNIENIAALKYEGWNFNSGNYLFTTDTK